MNNKLENEFTETLNNNLNNNLNNLNNPESTTVTANLVQQFTNGDFLMYNEEKKEFFLVTNTPEGIKIHGKKNFSA